MCNEEAQLEAVNSAYDDNFTGMRRDGYQYAHRIRRGDREVTVYGGHTYEEMGELYDEDYIGEVCIVTGSLIKPFISPKLEELLKEAAFEFSQGPHGQTAYELWCNLDGNNTDKTYSTFIKSISPPKGEAMHDPLHESVFGESNLADAVRGDSTTTQINLNPSWQELYAQDCADFGVDIANQRLVQRQQVINQVTELSPQRRVELEQLLQTTEIVPLEQMGITPPKRVGIKMPYRVDYAAACKGLRAWPLSPALLTRVRDQLRALKNPVPEIKGVVFRGSSLPAHMKAVMDDILNKPAFTGDEAVKFLDELSRQEAMRFLITSQPGEVIRALAKWLKRMRKRAEREAAGRRSGDKQLALFKINVEHLERQTFVVLDDIINTQGFSRSYIIDAVEDTTFNVSVKTESGGVPIMTVRYADYGFTVQAHR